MANKSRLNFHPKVFHRGLILVGVPIFVELLLISNLWLLLMRADREWAVEYRYRIYATCGARIMSINYEMPILLYTYIRSPDKRLMETFKADFKQARDLSARLKRLGADDPYAEDIITDATDSLEVFLGMMETVANTGGSGKAIELFTELPELKNKLTLTVDSGMERVSAIQRFSALAQVQSERRMKFIENMQHSLLFIGLLVNLIVGAVLFIYYKRSIMDRLSLIKQNTALLFDGSPQMSTVGGADEIAQLDLAFHSMKMQLQESAQREHASFENAADVICVLDAETRFVKVNQASGKRWQIESSKLLGRRLKEFLPERELELSDKQIEQAKCQPGGFTFELTLLGGDGNEFSTLWSVYWSEIENMLYCVVHDLSERKEAERMRRRFLLMISSDLKSPLASMSAAFETLLKESSKSSLAVAAVDKLERARNNLGRLLGLVNELLQVAEADYASLNIEKQECGILEIVERSLADIEALAEKKQIQVKLDLEDLQLEADPNRLIQVLVNLLSNSIKFSPVQSELQIVSAKQGGFVEVSVIDKGRGVPEKLQSKIFERFSQVSSEDGKRMTGTGLGLPICKQIVEAHGGLIGVESKEGAGSRFWFCLPLKDSLADKPLSPEDKSQSGSPLEEAVLVQEQNRDLLRRKSAKDGFGSALKLRYKGLLLIGVPLVFEVLFAWMLFVQLNYTEQMRKQELVQRRISTSASKMLTGYLKCGLLITATRSESTWLAFKEAYQDLRRVRKDLLGLLAADPVASAHFRRIEEYNRKCDKLFAESCRRMEGAYDRFKHGAAFDSRNDLLPLTAVVARRLRFLINDTEVRDKMRPKVQEQLRSRQAAVLIVGLSTNLLASILLAFYFSKDMSSRLGILADNAVRFARERDLNEQLRGSDEIAELDAFFHKTAATILAARQKERVVFDNSHDLICVLSRKGNFLSANPAALNLLGYTKDELLEKNIIEITAESDRAAVQKQLLFEQPETTDAETRKLECCHLRKDLSNTYLLWSASLSLNKDEIYCLAHDITSIKELEFLKQEFLAMVSHDLRTPLTSISGVAKLILIGALGKVDAAQEKVIVSIVSQTEQLLELINDLLDIEKLEAGKMQLNLESVELAELLDYDLCKALGERLTDRIEIAGELPDLSLKVDKERILQALSNLIKFAALRGKSKERAALLSVQADGDSLEIEVLDSGPVLSEEEAENLFVRYRNDLIDLRQAGSAAGLALPIASMIVTSHGGTIAVSRKTELGVNLFTLRLALEKSLPANLQADLS